MICRIFVDLRHPHWKIGGRPGQCTSVDIEPMSDLPPPDGRFSIIRVHASGGLGQVSLARDEKLQRQVALKEIRHDKRGCLDLRRRFLEEARITGQLEHPGIIPIYDIEEDAQGQTRYAMRFVQGKTLRQAIQDYHRSPEPLAFRRLLQRFVSVCETVAYAHSQGVIHRDLKPANVLLGDFGETLVVDWGLAKQLRSRPSGSAEAKLRVESSSSLDETVDYLASTDEAVGTDGLTREGEVLGTLAYMSPEQARGEIEATGTPADVYSLGATLYELLAGQHPCHGKKQAEALADVIDGRIHRPSQICKGVPKALEAVCLKAMSRNMADRYASASALAREVERWLADEPVTAYREPWWTRIARWQRRNRTLVIGIAILLVTTLLVGGAGAVWARIERETTTAVGRVDALREATPSSVPVLVSSLDLAGSHVRRRLRQLWAQEELPAGSRWRVGLAMLQVDPKTVRDPLTAMMLETEDPHEFLVIRDGLTPHMQEAAARLWKEALDLKTSSSRRFRLLVALAAFDPRSPNWPQVADTLTEQLLGANSLHLGAWTEGLAPVRTWLVQPLAEKARQRQGTEQGVVAATVIVKYAADQPNLLIDLLLDASPAQYEILWPKIPARAVTMTAIQDELAKRSPSHSPDSVKDRLASRQANAAVTRVRLGDEASVWPLLRASDDPRLRTYLIHRFGPLRVDPELLLVRLAVEQDPSIRRALLLSLGSYPADGIAPDRRNQVLAVATAAFRDDPDAGVHSAAEWLIGRLGRQTVVAEAERHLEPGERLPGRYWYVTAEGHTMAVLPGPNVFPLSTMVKVESGRQERIITQRIPYTFAVATRKVTLSQFRRFLRDHSDIKYPFAQPRAGEDENEPATQITWLEAAKYCRWLGELENIPESQMCFPRMEEIKEDMILPANYEQRTGYRLPTSAEWECACRAGSPTRFAFGSDEALLKEYGWHADNSHRLLQPVGMLKPNDTGLFDIYGLAYEWCSDLVYFSPEVPERRFRGSSRFAEPKTVANAGSGILANRMTYRGNECGMRIVRTHAESAR
ncbi:MAG TPA: bifunctional serine/threonine-protein kinase/formylglycine-generating enzyme family protein [Pirellulaceae bacterium]|nr:bifunctional serine/threonine-protein kinase/formylglycine-generating enzyme family protein [Pirellulaceae bacterium]